MITGVDAVILCNGLDNMWALLCDIILTPNILKVLGVISGFQIQNKSTENLDMVNA